MEQRDTSDPGSFDDLTDAQTRTRGTGQQQGQPAGPKKKHSPIKGCGCLTGAVVLIIIIVTIVQAAGSKTNNTTAGTSSVTTSQAATPVSGAGPATSAAAPPAAPAKTVVLAKSGEGMLSTKSFTVSEDWSLTYTFDCSSFGSQGNFQVYEDYPSGNVLVNALSEKGGDVTYQTGDAGKHSLEVNSECKWTITVTDGDDGQ